MPTIAAQLRTQSRSRQAPGFPHKCCTIATYACHSVALSALLAAIQMHGAEIVAPMDPGRGGIDEFKQCNAFQFFDFYGIRTSAIVTAAK